MEDVTVLQTDDWRALCNEPPALLPRSPTGKAAYKAIQRTLTAGDIPALCGLCATGSAAERLAALWLFYSSAVRDLVAEADWPHVAKAVSAALYQAEVLSSEWVAARGLLIMMDVAEEPLAEDLSRRGLTREQLDALKAEREKAELAARLPPVVDIPTAVAAHVLAHPLSPAPADLAERLRGSAEAWRERGDHAGLNTVYLYVVNLPPDSVSYRKLIDLLGSPNDFDESKAYYGNTSSGLVVLANPRGTIEAVKIN